METKKGALDKIKSIMQKHRDLGLSIKEGAAMWKRKPIGEEWKVIGYVSALAFCFDIEEVGLNEIR